MIKNFAIAFLLGFATIAFAINRNARPQVGEKQDSAITPNAPSGPKPRNEQDEIYRGPPSNWDEGRQIVDVQSSAGSEEHQKEKPQAKK